MTSVSRCVCVLLLCSVSSAFAQNPRLERIERAGGQRGTEFTIFFEGERLDAVNDVLFYEPGLTVRAIEPEDDTSIEITLHSSDDCRLGEHPLRLLSPEGASELRTIHIGPYPYRDEQEPNSTVSDAEAIPPGSTICGLIEEGDVDCFRVQLAAGQRLSAEVVGLRLGSYLFDAWLAVLDDQGTLLVQADDTALLRQDPLLSFIAPRDGDYIVQVRESAFGGDLDSAYQLHLGSHPRPTVASPCGGRPGEAVTVQLLGDAGGPITETIQIPETAEGFFRFYPGSGSDMAPSPIRLRVSDLGNVMEQEAGDDLSQLTTVAEAPPFALNGILQAPGDVDTFQFPAKAGDRFRVQTFAARVGSPLDSVVSIQGPDGIETVRNDDGAHHDSELLFYAPVDGDYTLTVTDHQGRGRPDAVYRIEFSEVRPSLELAVPMLSGRRPQQRQLVRVARGNRCVLLVTARRFGFSGEIQLTPQELPPGVHAHAVTIEPDSHLTHILFEADKDAPLSQGLMELTGTAETPAGTVTGRLKQQIGLCFGPPRRTPYHGVEVDRIPLVVTPEAPFRLTVNADSTPLIRDGRLDLPVYVQRSPDFDGDVRLSLPFLPPWLEGPEDPVEIPEGQNSAIFPITAAAEAESRSWQLVLLGEGMPDGESVFASSALFEVRVADPLLTLAMTPAATEQGSRTKLHCTLDWKQPLDAGVVARLRGLPAHVTVPDVRLTAADREFTFAVDVGREAPASFHNTLFVELTIEQAGRRMTHFLSRKGVLEVFEPGQRARETRSRLEVLREQARKQKPDLVDVNSLAD